MVDPDRVGFLGKPTGGDDGAAADGLTMDLVRQFEAEPMAALGYTATAVSSDLSSTLHQAG